MLAHLFPRYSTAFNTRALSRRLPKSSPTTNRPIVQSQSHRPRRRPVVAGDEPTTRAMFQRANPSVESTRLLLNEERAHSPVELVPLAQSSSTAEAINAQPTPGPHQWLQGWRSGAIFFGAGTFISLFINVFLAIWTHRLSDDGIAVLTTTNCETVASYNTWIHAGVNAMSTLLLSGSNYCMQCLSAPTRNEVQKAHSKGIWLDIGVSSVRNLRYIAVHKIWLWGLLILSSIPLHLM